MNSYMDISVSSSDIAREMARDDDLAYGVLSEISYYLGTAQYQNFVDKLFKNIFEDENTDLLNLLSTIVKQFEHLKEKDEISDSNSFA
jgi:hypothetical protein